MDLLEYKEKLILLLKVYERKIAIFAEFITEVAFDMPRELQEAIFGKIGNDFKRDVDELKKEFKI